MVRLKIRLLVSEYTWVLWSLERDQRIQKFDMIKWVRDYYRIAIWYVED